jgi:preprotein translocase subunit SecY
MFKSLMAAFAVPELRQRILFVFGMFAVFMIGLHIPVPGINRKAMENLVNQNGILQLFDTFSGGAFRKFTIFAMGITPYINASIIMQLLTVAMPQLEELAKEGEGGRKQIAKYTRQLTVVLCVVQAVGLVAMLGGFHFGGHGPQIIEASPLTLVQIIVTLTAGTLMLLWIGEMISERGLGQGVSLIIFVSIMARMPYDVSNTLKGFSFEPGAAVTPLGLFLLVALFLGMVVAIIYVQEGMRRVPIQHAKRTVGNRTYQGGGSFLPLRVNTAGVMPIIFAISLLMFPATIASWFFNAPAPYNRWAHGVAGLVQPGQSWFASVIYGVLIMAFTYFYAAIQINIPELADNLKKYGSFVPGIRPGRPTQEYLDRVMTRITFAGAVFLTVIGLMQYYTRQITGVQTFSLVGGTSLLIVVGVALDTMQSLESHLVMRNYEGFIKQAR